MKNESAPKSAPETAAKWSGSILAQATDFPPFIRRRTPEQDAYYAELATFLGQCRRRREDAALRLPPLDDGRRDPIGKVTDGAQL